ncbi:hypothetical protein [Mesorhizobium sp. M7A.F.Ca.US.008.03.1.1]|uniref:hypothetical protein n=1 Tax=Mesorhizobium sp. M7A.F.Ca.US.008.03.1.1 TaxID=2496742 RepID=UPI000FCAE4A8|nr:hypothetical protein [Mesorhizobium sp. M7A.F.Ca.US.008.03.1.1]RUW62418.1 hypothetical protein EOA16_09340 [Mesorhizobium sp. M7A.F.Ca.US.008.03.1.1]
MDKESAFYLIERLKESSGYEAAGAALIAAFLAYMTFGSLWGAGLFGFLAFMISGVGAIVTIEIRKAWIDLGNKQ